MDSEVTLNDSAPSRAGKPSIYEKRKRILLEINFGMVILGGIFFIVINYSRGLYLVSLIQAMLCILFSVLLVMVIRNHDLVGRSCWVYVLACLALSVYAFLEPRSHVTTFTWAIILIFITMIMLGRRSGLIICLLYVPLSIAILWWKYRFAGHPLPLIGLANFTVIYAVSLVFAIYSESTRFDIEKELEEANQSLENANTQLKQQNDELSNALAEVKILSGFLPICASCKKIRDDQGYWNQVEAYIEKHSYAQFSHSVCPECAKRLYPELDL